jgi:hypothetical protein
MVGGSGLVQTVSVYSQPRLTTTCSSDQPVWKLPKKPRKKRRAKPKISPVQDGAESKCSGAYPTKSYKYWLTHICDYELQDYKHFCCLQSIQFCRTTVFTIILSQFGEKYL